jgi:hypothetical protein
MMKKFAASFMAVCIVFSFTACKGSESEATDIPD